MELQEIIIHTTNDSFEVISNLLQEEGANGTVVIDSADLIMQKEDTFGEKYRLNHNDYPETGIYIKAYFLNNDRFPIIFKHISNLLDTRNGKDILILDEHITTKTVREEDWENNWKQYFKPIQISDRFFIVPEWESNHHEKSNLLPIYIDPGLAFGTGTHPTTILGIQALEKFVQKKDIVLDVGSGSGVLSIASILLGAKKVYAFDLDEIAIKSTKANRDLNKFQKQITVEKNNLLRGIHKQANVIVANILADILMDVVADAWDNLQTGGYFITSGIIPEKQHTLRTKIEEKSFRIIQENKLENWVSIIAQKV